MVVKMCIVMALSEDWEEEVRGKTKKRKKLCIGRRKIVKYDGLVGMQMIVFLDS